MKRTFLARRNGLLSAPDLLWGVGALGFALVVLLTRLLAPNFFWHAFAPVFSAADALAQGSGRLFSGFENAAALAEENDRLREERIALISENRALSERVEDLAALSASPATVQESRTIFAGVVARPPESPYDTLVLAAGARVGVTLGMEVFGLPAQTEGSAVASVGGVPLGVVSSVSDDFSRATLFSAPGMQVAGWAGEANVPLTVYGAGAGALEASVARAAGIAEGDVIFVPGPGKLPLGVVVRVDDDSPASDVTLRVRPLANPFSIAWVALRDVGALFTAGEAAAPEL